MKIGGFVIIGGASVKAVVGDLIGASQVVRGSFVSVAFGFTAAVLLEVDANAFVKSTSTVENFLKVAESYSL